LARLEELRAGVTVEVDRSGTLVRVSPADRSGEVLTALAKSGIRSEVLGNDAAARATAGVTNWFSRANIWALSKEEFHILTRRWATEIRRATALTDSEEERLAQSLEAAYDAAIAKIPAESGLAPDPTVWRAAKAAAVEQVVRDASSYLRAEQVDKLRGVLAAKL
jgi:hypothetical protein